MKNIPDLSEIYPWSVNSFRILTYFVPGLGAKAIYSILKLGNNNAFTDNAHTGGIYVRIDPESGVLDEIAYDEDLFEYQRHPATGYEFRGRRINGINKVVEIAETLGNKLPNLAFIGWDIALTPDGPVVLEGNSSPGLTIIQRTHGGMKKFINLVADIESLDLGRAR